jgi:hypothetical protein
MTEPSAIFIIDNGAYNIKANYSPYNDPYGMYDAGPSTSTSTTKSSKKKAGKKSTKRGTNKAQQSTPEQIVQLEDPYEPKTFHNFLVRTRDKQTRYGADLESIKDQGSLVFRSPFERGLLTSWQPEHSIFNHMFEQFNDPKNPSRFDPTSTSLLITEPYLNPPALGENYDQMVFEEWEFASYARSCGKSGMKVLLRLLLCRTCLQSTRSTSIVHETGGRDSPWVSFLFAFDRFVQCRSRDLIYVSRFSFVTLLYIPTGNFMISSVHSNFPLLFRSRRCTSIV